MSDEKKSIFRQKAMDRVSSPEELDHYLQVTSPGIWITLAAIILLLTGVFFWGIFGRLETEMHIATVVNNGKAVCYIPRDLMDNLHDGPVVAVNDERLALKDESLAPVVLSEDTDPSVILAGDLSVNQVVYLLTADTVLEDGVYIGAMIVDAVTPISLILN